MRPTDRVKMLKSTFFEGRIRSRSKDEFIVYFANWMKAITDRGYTVPKEEPMKIALPPLATQKT